MKTTLFYDGSCPLCSKEIRWLKKMTANRLQFADIHQLDQQEKMDSYPSREALLRRLHLQTDDGQWLTGLDATVYAWSLTAFGLPFKLLRVRPLRYLTDAIYNRWADRRYRQRYQCAPCTE
jgi:predicted DCC family thiol-disulfide oxidoreductase YuxK